jgi:hypothetical protein
MTRHLWLALPLALAACAGQPQSHASAAAQAACKQRADEVYTQQNRDQVYASDTYVSRTRDTPFNGAGMPGSGSEGLSSLYARDQILSNCLDGINSGASATPTPAKPVH